MHWLPLTDINQLSPIIEASKTKPQLLFKHSTTCHISITAKSRLDKVADASNVDCHYLDLLNYRSVSTAIAEIFKVHHESPQVILLKNGEAVYDESHLAIYWDEIQEQVSN